MNKKRLSKQICLIALGFALWLWFGPILISLSHETGSFLSFTSWLGLLTSLSGVLILLYGISRGIA